MSDVIKQIHESSDKSMKNLCPKPILKFEPKKV